MTVLQHKLAAKDFENTCGSIPLLRITSLLQAAIGEIIVWIMKNEGPL